MKAKATISDRCWDAPPTPKAETPRGPWGLFVVLLLAGFLLVAHGCHGDEDNELLALVRFVKGSIAR